MGRLTRVGVELDGKASRERVADELAIRAPGRETLVAVEARRQQHSDKPAMPSQVAPAWMTSGRAVMSGAVMSGAVMSGAVMSGAMQHRAAMILRREMADADVDVRDPAIERALERAGQGEPLPELVRREMEARLRADFRRVRVHTDDVAARAANALQASAFTLGENIFFAAGMFAPLQASGQRLLVHELTHVVQSQQGRVPAKPGIEVSRPSDALEHEAATASDRLGSHNALDADANAHGAIPEREPAANGQPGVPQSSAGRAIQRQVSVVLPDPMVVTSTGEETILTLTITRTPHRVRLRIDEPSLRGHQAFAYQYVPEEPSIGSSPTLRIVAARGVAVIPEGWPSTAFIAGLDHPGLEVFRVQDPALVPPQGDAIIPSRYVGQRLSGPPGGGFLVLPPVFVIRATMGSVEITHVESGVTLHIDVRLTSTDAFAYEVIEGRGLRERPTIRVVKTPSTPLFVRAGTGALPVDVIVAEVDRVSEVPPQGRPLAGIGRELDSIPARLELTVEQQIACAGVPMAISMIPVVGEIYMIFDFVYGVSTGRDPLCQQRRDTDGHVLAGLGALLGFVALGARGLSLIGQATGRSGTAAEALAQSIRELSESDRATIARLDEAVRGGGSLSPADVEALANILRRIDARAAELAGGAEGLARLLNAERTGFVEPELQMAYQRYLAEAGEEALGPAAWARTPEGEAAFREVFGELGPETAGLPPGGARSARPPGRPHPESPHPHVQQATPDWCGAACGEMAARRLGTEVSQADLAATPYFTPRTVVDHVLFEEGFHAEDLANALSELAPVAGRRWVGGNITDHSIDTAAELATTLEGFLRSSRSSIILRVRGGRHWILIDEILADGSIAIRDPGLRSSSALTAEQLFQYRPTGHVVMSFPSAPGGTP